MSDIDLIIERLELRGHRITASRRRVIDAVLAQPDHFTVDDVLHSTRKVGRATVFRTIRLLLDLNIVCRVMLDGGDAALSREHARPSPPPRLQQLRPRRGLQPSATSSRCRESWRGRWTMRSTATGWRSTAAVTPAAFSPRRSKGGLRWLTLTRPPRDSRPLEEHASCLVLRDVTIAYGRRVVLSHVDADIPRGQLVSLVGPNGSGKSTLLKAIAGLIPLAAGEITLFGQPIAKMRKHVAYVPQREDVEWAFPVSVHDVVLMGRYPKRGWLTRSTAEDRSLVASALDQLGIADLASRQIARAVRRTAAPRLHRPGAGAGVRSHLAGRADGRHRRRDARPHPGAVRRVARAGQGRAAGHAHSYARRFDDRAPAAALDPVPAHQFEHQAEEGWRAP